MRLLCALAVAGTVLGALLGGAAPAHAAAPGPTITLTALRSNTGTQIGWLVSGGHFSAYSTASLYVYDTAAGPLVPPFQTSLGTGYLSVCLGGPCPNYVIGPYQLPPLCGWQDGGHIMKVLALDNTTGLWSNSVTYTCPWPPIVACLPSVCTHDSRPGVLPVVLHGHRVLAPRIYGYVSQADRVQSEAARQTLLPAIKPRK
jgi:hypothetical protein